MQAGLNRDHQEAVSLAFQQALRSAHKPCRSFSALVIRTSPR
jgi:hypothetical protein